MAILDRYQVSVLLTEQCNMRCRYCTTAKRDGDMSSEVMAQVVRLLETTEPAGLDVNFHGGEPTLHWDGIVELAERLKPTASRRRVSYNMCTNATFIDAERAFELGLATTLCAPETVLADAMARAEVLAEKPLGSLRYTKRLVLATRAEQVRLARERETEGFARRVGSPENVEAVTAFLEKRPADFSRVPSDDIERDPPRS